MQREVIRNESRDDISKEMFVVLSLENYRERPLIGRVNKLFQKTLKITWLHGHWTMPWSICKRREGQRHIEWQEEVPKESVMLFDFQLTSSGKLRRQVTVRELKRVYGLQQDEDSS